MTQLGKVMGTKPQCLNMPPLAHLQTDKALHKTMCTWLYNISSVYNIFKKSM